MREHQGESGRNVNSRGRLAHSAFVLNIDRVFIWISPDQEKLICAIARPTRLRCQVEFWRGWFGELLRALGLKLLNTFGCREISGIVPPSSWMVWRTLRPPAK